MVEGTRSAGLQRSLSVRSHSYRPRPGDDPMTSSDRHYHLLTATCWKKKSERNGHYALSQDRGAG